MIEERPAQELLNRHYSRKLMDQLSRPSMFLEMLPKAPKPSFWQRVRSRWSARLYRARDAWMVLVGKAEIKEDEL